MVGMGGGGYGRDGKRRVWWGWEEEGMVGMGGGGYGRDGRRWVW